ncbi:MAG: M20 family metallo-hydrolase [Candidatus Bathyarchaeota archaeon]|nr:M20 family metallo-hydrolase [Candidatus Termiticorpusculum sp.]
MDKSVVFAQIDCLRQEMVEALMSLISVPAVAPENGGEGELRKAECLVRILEGVGFDKIERYDAPDVRVFGGLRPNVVAYFSGVSDVRRLWIVLHLDVVPSGNLDAWTVTAPFSPVLSGDYVFGRGSEDNGQPLVSSIFALKALKLLEIKPMFTVGLVFVSDEEQGSRYGIEYLLKHHSHLFQPDDLVVVPDAGNALGDFIEVAEKSMLWFKLCVMGRQVHGSRPDTGLNAHRIGMQVALALDEFLHEKYSAQNPLFDVPISTFEPTRKECNVEAINIIPGEDITFFDCRILPKYDLNEVLADIQNVLNYYEEKTGAKITLNILQKNQSSTSPSSSFMFEADKAEVVLCLKAALKEARGIEASVGGVGGGTCGAFFRQIGIPVAVWCTLNDMAHQPNEYAKISAMIDDAKVFALLAMGYNTL